MDQQKRINITPIINIKSNIKALGWILIFVFGCVFLYSAFSIAGGVLVQIYQPVELHADDPHAQEFSDIFNLILNVYLVALLISIFMIVAGKSILKYKLWSVYLFHFVSIIIVLGILIGIVYMYFEFIDKSTTYQRMAISETSSRFSDMMIKLQFIFYGTFGLFIAWVMTRMNLLLIRKDYRKYFK